MRAHTPQQGNDASRRRSSITSAHRTSMGSSIPRVQSRIAAGRAASSNQPTFDFLTGAELRPGSRGEPFRQSARVVSGGNKDLPLFETETEREKRHKELEELKAEVKTLKYTIDNHKQEEELSKLRQESELRDVRRKAEEDFKKMQAADSEKAKAVRQHELLLKEVTEVRDAASNEKAALERRLHEIEDGKRLLEEEIEDVRSEKEETLRTIERKIAEIESRNETLQRTVEELQQDSDRREALLQDAQQQLSEKENAYGSLEAENIRLKAQTGDADTLAIIKRELSEQVTHIRKLEVNNREQAAELKHFKRLHKAVEVVEEEKRTLQRKLDAVEGLENELGEARIQRQRLEDEQLAWTGFLESQAGSDGQLEFDSPEAIARALVAERLQTASLVERVGAIEAELSTKDSTIQSLEEEKSKFSEQLEKVKSTNGTVTNSKTHMRLERQKALAIKEAEYLRAQLKTYDTEDTTFQPETVDEAKIKRIQELEDMVEQYRGEVQTLNTELSTREPLPLAPQSPAKRPHDDSEDNERVGQLLRKKRKLEDEFSTLQNSTKLLQKELSVTKERLTAASQQSKTRILSLRSNPTSDFEAIKLSTLNALRQENADLLARLLSPDANIESVPLSTLKASQRDVDDAKAALASEKKRNDRLMKVWGAKSTEFRNLVISLLGWDVVFMKDGKMRVTSFFYPSKGDDENSIVFDGEKGTMKISGGPESAFAVKISDQIKFWVKERGCIPGFLAALTLEFWEEANNDGTLRVD
ncbi:MAD-domain-containing protein [Mollisia scopiformis]|uniref:Spindle assembly checkpoint component MAD1 n=1 Tax=Mollisia scopiformis TaxID=149040 RepID=A0A194X9Y8_MOLSC|nr:MAD-domain-containing protein [Mollisia scopiformis]KUJ16986.1 MAD-domain-containing protein [Mollisia scopiformis]